MFTLKQAPGDSDDPADRGFMAAMPVPRALDFPAGVDARTKVLGFQRITSGASSSGGSGSSTGLLPGAGGGGRPFSGQQAHGNLTARRNASAGGGAGGAEETFLAFGSRFPVSMSPMKTARDRGRSRLDSTQQGGIGNGEEPPFSPSEPSPLSQTVNHPVIRDNRPESVGVKTLGPLTARARIPSRTHNRGEEASAGAEAGSGPGSARGGATQEAGRPTKLQMRKPARLEPLDVSAAPPGARADAAHPGSNGAMGQNGLSAAAVGSSPMGALSALGSQRASIDLSSGGGWRRSVGGGVPEDPLSPVSLQAQNAGPNSGSRAGGLDNRPAWDSSTNPVRRPVPSSNPAGSPTGQQQQQQGLSR